MRSLTLIVGLGLVFGAAAAGAEHRTDKNTATGDKTREWLALQREGHAASDQPQAVSGPVAAKIYRRYQDSFTYPIPEYFSGDDGDASVLGK